ncbi:MAG: RhuM family protein [Pseudomonadales bacterium]|nr:RhuM family protein [Pseudomonadales bacterium]
MAGPSKTVSIIRSSAAEYLTFVAATGDSETSVEMRYEDENIWLTQKMMATLYAVTLPAIIAVGFKIENESAVQFRKWANQIVKDYTIQG